MIDASTMPQPNSLSAQIQKDQQAKVRSTRKERNPANVTSSSSSFTTIATTAPPRSRNNSATAAMSSNVMTGDDDEDDDKRVDDITRPRAALKADPFAYRHGPTLFWTGVNMSVATRVEEHSYNQEHHDGKPFEKQILTDVYGQIEPGQTTAIMGPSGAGKTSLLNVLAGRLRNAPPRRRISGHLYLCYPLPERQSRAGLPSMINNSEYFIRELENEDVSQALTVEHDNTTTKTSGVNNIAATLSVNDAVFSSSPSDSADRKRTLPRGRHGNESRFSGARLIDPTRQSVRKNFAFVAQRDSLQVTSTVRESIEFSARMRLSRNLTRADIAAVTDRILDELGLQECSNTLIGGALVSGISGGERKRTSVGVELVTQPSMLFLDEPTTGLDSFSAVQLITLLKRIAASGCAVCLTIHQPASEIFQALDQLIMLKEGKLMFQGAISSVPDLLSRAGHPLPENYNPADWLVQIAQAVQAEALAYTGEFFLPDDRIVPPLIRSPSDGGTLARPTSPFRSTFEGTLAAMSVRNLTDKSAMKGSPWGKKPVQTVGIFYQMAELLKREILNLTRFPLPLTMRWGGDTLMALLISLIYQGVGRTDRADQANVRSTFGALVMSSLMAQFGSAEPSLLYFPLDRPVFLREFATNHYRVVSYFFSRVLIEALVTLVQVLVQSLLYVFIIDLQIPFGELVAINYLLALAGTSLAVFLGCLVDDPKTASELLPVVLIPQMLFAGFYVATDLIPAWLQWAQYLCALTYAVRLGVIGEFSDCGDDPQAIENCDRLLERNSVNPDDAPLYWGILVVLFVAFRVAAVLALALRANKLS